LFLLHSQEALESFLAQPHDFVPSNAVIPPPRIAVSGPKCAGKSTVIKSIPSFAKIPLIDYRVYMDAFVAKHPDMNEMDVIVAGLKTLYTDAPYKMDGVVLEGFPRHKLDAEAFLSVPDFSLDAVVYVKADPDTLVDRLSSDDTTDEATEAIAAE
jgi:adenylate kinase family enzyme